MTPCGDGALVDVFDGNGKSVADAIARVHRTESAFAEDVTDVVGPTERLAVRQRHLMRGRRRDGGGRRCRCPSRHRYCHNNDAISTRVFESRREYVI